MSEGSGKIKLLLLMAVFLMITISGAKAAYDYRTVEDLTSRYFGESKWDSVIYVGKKGIHDGIDYYYLRLRLGISYYNTGRYFQASEHLNKAIAFNSMDPVAYQYLYNSYQRSNREEEARHLQKKMHQPEKAKIITGDLLQYVYAEGGPVLSSDDGRKPTANLYGADSIYGEEDLYGNSWYIYAGLKAGIASWLSVELGYTYLDFQKTKNVQYSYFRDELDSTVNFWWGYQNYYSFHRITENRSFNYDVRQSEGHLGFNITVPRQFTISPAFHIVRDNYSSPVTKFSSQTVMDTAWVDTSAHTFPFIKNEYSFTNKDTSYYNYVASLKISKTISNVQLSLSGSWSDLNGVNQKQAGINATWYPLGDLSLYETTALTSFWQEKDNRLIIQQIVGGKPLKKLWVEGMVIFGDITNANLSNASVVYNNAGKVDFITGLSAGWIFTKNLVLILNYRYGMKKSIQYYYTVNNQGERPSVSPESKYNSYTTNTLTAGIKWKF